MKTKGNPIDTFEETADVAVDALESSVIAAEPAAESSATAEESMPQRLDGLMRKALARRSSVHAAQQKLLDIELEMRQADTDKRSRFERMRAAALDEYRRAKAEATRARHQLLSNLRTLVPSRS